MENLEVRSSPIYCDLKSSIRQRTKCIYKSWLNDSDVEAIRGKKLLLHRQVFQHPMITTAFVANLAHLKSAVKYIHNWKLLVARLKDWKRKTVQYFQQKEL